MTVLRFLHRRRVETYRLWTRFLWVCAAGALIGCCLAYKYHRDGPVYHLGDPIIIHVCGNDGRCVDMPGKLGQR